MVVGLLSFGQQAQRGDYHLDGRRGWDMPPNAALDSAQAHSHFAVHPRPPIVSEQVECGAVALVLPMEAPIRQFATLRAWFRLRPPPED